MGAWRRFQAVVVVAALLGAAPAAAGTVMEPIARLTLEGGWDSNALYDGRSADRVGRISPDLGLRLHGPLLDLRTTYGGEWVWYERLVPGGAWNHRAALSLDARPTARTAASGDLRLSQSIDPAALAQAGVFRTGRHRALLVGGRARLGWRPERLEEAALTVTERFVRFDDGTGGAMHAPGVEVLRRVDRRLSLGGAYGFGLFQSFGPGAAPDELATAHALRLRARWRAGRHVSLEGWAGPALWLPRGGAAVVPEALVEAVVATRGLDVRASAGHGLGIGATAEPGLVDFAEVGAGRRFGRTWFVRGDGGLWRSGRAPTGAESVVGYAVAGEAGAILRGGLRLSVTGAHYGRADAAAPQYRRTTAGLRLGWELRAR